MYRLAQLSSACDWPGVWSPYPLCWPQLLLNASSYVIVVGKYDNNFAVFVAYLECFFSQIANSKLQIYQSISLRQQKMEGISNVVVSVLNLDCTTAK